MHMPVLITFIARTAPVASLSSTMSTIPSSVVHDDPAVARRVLHLGGHEGDAFRPREELYERAQGRGLDEGDVAVEHEDVAGHELRGRGEEGVGRPLLLLLVRKAHLRPFEAALHQRLPVAGHHDDPLRRERLRRLHHIADHGFAHDGVGDLRDLRPHPRAFACRQYHAVKPLHRCSPFFRRPSRSPRSARRGRTWAAP